jgi:hypothetical protein
MSRPLASADALQDDLATLPPLLTPKELGAFLRIPLKTLYQWHYLRTGPIAFRVGRHLRYRRSAVARWLASVEEPGNLR